MQRSSGGCHSFKSPGRFIHSKWAIEMRGDEHSEMSPSLGFDGLAVCIVQSANLIPRLSTERFGLRGRQRRGECRGEKIGESKRKALINLISTHMLDAVRQIWII